MRSALGIKDFLFRSTNQIDPVDEKHEHKFLSKETSTFFENDLSIAYFVLQH